MPKNKQQSKIANNWLNSKSADLKNYEVAQETTASIYPLKYFSAGCFLIVVVF
jgi:hypothetical protein